MSRRWTAFFVAVGTSVVLAVGFGVAVRHLVATTRPAPTLRTVPAQTLPQAGMTVVAASQPPYCEFGRGIAERRWMSGGIAGCAITRAEAEAALLPVFQGHVSEAVLARVTGPAASDLGRDRLVWMVVVQSSLLVLPTTACAPPVASGPACAVSHLGPVSKEVIVFVDAANGQVLTSVPVPGQAAGSPSSMTAGLNG
jgi:hypothetical protein